MNKARWYESMNEARYRAAMGEPGRKGTYQRLCYILSRLPNDKVYDISVKYCDGVSYSRFVVPDIVANKHKVKEVLDQYDFLAKESGK